MNKTELHKPYYPACIIAVLIVLVFGLCNICQLYLLEDSYPVSKLWVGSDYACIYSATQNLVRAGSPYDKNWTLPPIAEQFVGQEIIHQEKKSPWYTYSPLPAYLNYPFVYFDLDAVSRFIFFLLIAAILSAYVLINRTFAYRDKRDGSIIFLAGLMIMVLSYPFYFLIVRGHFVGIVIMLLALGLFLLKKNNPASSICFGLSIGIIMFPALLLVPLLLFRRYKIIIYTFITLTGLVLLCPHLWLEFLTKFLIPRTMGEGYYLVGENCSLTNTFLFFTMIINKLFSTAGLPKIGTVYCNILSHIANLTFFLTMAIADFQIRKKYKPWDTEIEIALTMMYIPLMIAAPTVSMQYGLVLIILLIPVLCSLMIKLDKPMPIIILWIFMGGIFLSQIQAHSLQILFNPKNQFFHFFPAFGLLLVMIGCVTFKLWFWMTYAHRARS